MTELSSYCLSWFEGKLHGAAGSFSSLLYPHNLEHWHSRPPKVIFICCWQSLSFETERRETCGRKDDFSAQQPEQSWRGPPSGSLSPRPPSSLVPLCARRKSLYQAPPLPGSSFYWLNPPSPFVLPANSRAKRGREAGPGRRRARLAGEGAEGLQPREHRRKLPGA